MRASGESATAATELFGGRGLGIYDRRGDARLTPVGAARGGKQQRALRRTREIGA